MLRGTVNKSTDNCVHKVESIWEFTDVKIRQRKSKILNRRRHTNPKTGGTLETYEWKNKKRSQHLKCHEKDLARVYDFRFESARLLNSSVLNRIESRFPRVLDGESRYPKIVIQRGQNKRH